MSPIFVVGGGGFIGRRVVGLLIEAGQPVAAPIPKNLPVAGATAARGRARPRRRPGSSL